MPVQDATTDGPAEDVFDEDIVVDANNEIVDTSAFEDYMEFSQIEDFDYMDDEEEVEGNNNKNDILRIIF